MLFVFNRKKIVTNLCISGNDHVQNPVIKPVMLDCVKTNESYWDVFFLLLSFKHRDNEMYLIYEVI